MTDKELLAEALRRYPTWGHAYLAEREVRRQLAAALEEQMARWHPPAYSGTMPPDVAAALAASAALDGEEQASE